MSLLASRFKGRAAVRPGRGARTRRLGPRLASTGGPIGVVLAAVLAAGAMLSAAAPASARDPASRGVLEPKASLATRVFRRGTAAGKVVALTFDDGYSASRLRSIFRILVEERVPATFFVNGVYLARAPALWQAIAASGYPIGNHTYLHRDVRTLTSHQVEVDLLRNARAVERVTGIPIAPLFRPPYGHHTTSSDAAAAAAGFPNVILWDVTDGDTLAHATDASVRSAASAGVRGSIVLLHAGPKTTPRVLRQVIDRYRARGFGFVSVPVLLQIPWQPPMSAPDWNRVGVAAPTTPPVSNRPGVPVAPAASPGPGEASGGTGAPPSDAPGAGASAAAIAGRSVSGGTWQDVPGPVDGPNPAGRSTDLEWGAVWLTLLALGGLIAVGSRVGARDRRRAARSASLAMLATELPAEAQAAAAPSATELPAEAQAAAAPPATELPAEPSAVAAPSAPDAAAEPSAVAAPSATELPAEAQAAAAQLAPDAAPGQPATAAPSSAGEPPA